MHADGAGFIDLLCIDGEARVVVVEFKRDRSTRYAIAQALDYASWVRLAAPGRIESIAEDYLKCPLAQKFEGHFGIPLGAVNVEQHRIILAAPGLDSSAERIVSYLAEQHGVSINAISFQYARTGGGEILARSALVAEGLPSPPPARLTLAAILAMAQRRGVLPIVQVCRDLGKVFPGVFPPDGEETWGTYGGSLRYWLGGRMLVGINVSGQRRGAPQGQLDAWVQAERLAEAAGVPEAELRNILRLEFQAEDAGQSDCILRLGSTDQAKGFVSRIASWIQGGARGGNSAAAASAE